MVKRWMFAVVGGGWWAADSLADWRGLFCHGDSGILPPTRRRREGRRGSFRMRGPSLSESVLGSRPSKRQAGGSGQEPAMPDGTASGNSEVPSAADQDTRRWTACVGGNSGRERHAAAAAAQSPAIVWSELWVVPFASDIDLSSTSAHWQHTSIFPSLAARALIKVDRIFEFGPSAEDSDGRGLGHTVNGGMAHKPLACKKAGIGRKLSSMQPPSSLLNRLGR